MPPYGPPMTTHTHRPPDRSVDVAVVGGSASGLAAALQLARQRREVVVVDAGEPRNAPAAHMHGYLGHEGVAPGDFLATAREEVRSYGVEVLRGTVDDITSEDGQFRLHVANGHRVRARRVIVATGLVDVLPDIDGLAAHWGGDVVHCPFCHGFEVRDQQLVQIVTHPMGLHPAPLLRRLTDRLTLVLHDGVTARDPALVRLRRAGVPVLEQRVRRVVDDATGRLAGVELEDGTTLPADAVVVGPGFRVRTDALTSLAPTVVAHPSGLGDVVETDPTGATSVPGLYAVGNIADPSQQVLHAAANGTWVGGMVAFSLANEDLDAPPRPSPGQSFWDEAGATRHWSGAANPVLVAEVAGMAPGTALDVGAGEGGDGVWLAASGWTVTASDISTQTLSHVAGLADDQGVKVDTLHADVNGPTPFGGATHDLVTAHYVPIPRSPDDRGIRNLLAAVGPGGTLLFVSHALRPSDGTDDHRPFLDPDAFVRPADIAETIAGDPDWEVEVLEVRAHPRGPDAPDIPDDVLRARRRP